MTLFEVLTSGSIDNPFLLSWLVFKEGGWIVFLVVFLRGMWLLWMNYIWNDYASKKEWVLLAIDVPRNNEQTPKAVENFFSQIAGAHHSITKWDKYWNGKTQEFLSFEIVSVGGNVQYLVRCITKHRDLVEASVYAQYPDAEITEVEDYVDSVPKSFPNETHKLWGCEFLLQNDHCYPIKTYPEFEHIMAQEMKDPLSGVIETMSAIGPNEQVWFQIVTTPASHKWGESCQALLNKLLGKSEAKKGALSFLNTGLIAETREQVAFGRTGVDASAQQGDQANQIPLSLLSPGEYKAIDAIQRKMSKWAFECKIRMIYLARNDSFSPPRVVNPIIGALKQYTDFNTNALYPDMKRTATRAAYLFVKQRIAYRTRRLFIGYKLRSNYLGRSGYYLNVEELATLYHFPITQAKISPVIQTSSKKFDAPLATPFEGVQAPGEEPAERKTLEELRQGAFSQEQEATSSDAQQADTSDESIAPPSNLPM